MVVDSWLDHIKVSWWWMYYGANDGGSVGSNDGWTVTVLMMIVKGRLPDGLQQ